MYEERFTQSDPYKHILSNLMNYGRTGNKIYLKKAKEIIANYTIHDRDKLREIVNIASSMNTAAEYVAAYALCRNGLPEDLTKYIVMDSIKYENIKTVKMLLHCDPDKVTQIIDSLIKNSTSVISELHYKYLIKIFKEIRKLGKKLSNDSLIRVFKSYAMFGSCILAREVIQLFKDLGMKITNESLSDFQDLPVKFNIRLFELLKHEGIDVGSVISKSIRTPYSALSSDSYVIDYIINVLNDKDFIYKYKQEIRGDLISMKHLVKLLELDKNLINADLGGGTRLIHLAMYNDLSMIKYLIAKGADPTIRTDDGKSVYYFLIDSMITGISYGEYYRIAKYLVNDLKVPLQRFEGKCPTLMYLTYVYMTMDLRSRSKLLTVLFLVNKGVKQGVFSLDDSISQCGNIVSNYLPLLNEKATVGDVLSGILHIPKDSIDISKLSKLLHIRYIEAKNTSI